MIRLDNAITIIEGEDRDVFVTLLVDNEPYTPYDLTGASEIVARFIDRNGEELDKSITGGAVTIEDATCGKIKIALAVADTNQLKISDKQSFEVLVTIAGKVRKCQIMNRLNVKASLKC